MRHSGVRPAEGPVSLPLPLLGGTFDNREFPLRENSVIIQRALPVTDLLINGKWLKIHRNRSSDRGFVCQLCAGGESSMANFFRPSQNANGDILD
jgi:hypothetical protein